MISDNTTCRLYFFIVQKIRSDSITCRLYFFIVQIRVVITIRRFSFLTVQKIRSATSICHSLLHLQYRRYDMPSSRCPSLLHHTKRFVFFPLAFAPYIQLCLSRFLCGSLLHGTNGQMCYLFSSVPLRRTGKICHWFFFAYFCVHPFLSLSLHSTEGSLSHPFSVTRFCMVQHICDSFLVLTSAPHKW